MAARRVRLGIVGLGRLWTSTHLPALARLGNRFEVVALYDQVARRAEREADQMGCRVQYGLSSLVDDPLIDAVAWLAPQWFGIHPLAQTVARGKPILCGLPVPTDPADLVALEETLRSGRQPVRVAWDPGSIDDEPAPLTRRFGEFADRVETDQGWDALVGALRGRLATRGPVVPPGQQP